MFSKKKIIIVMLLLVLLLKVGIVHAEEKAEPNTNSSNNIVVYVSPFGIRMTFMGDVAKSILNSSIDLQEYGKVLIKIYVKDEDLEKLKFVNATATNSTISFYYKFTNVSIKNDGYLTYIETPKIKLKNPIILYIYTSYTQNNKTYVSESTNNNLKIGYEIPSIKFYDVSTIVSKTIIIKITPSGYVHIFFDNNTDIVYYVNGNYTLDKYKYGNKWLNVITLKLENNNSISIKNHHIFSITYPSCYTFERKNEKITIVKGDSCNDSFTKKVEGIFNEVDIFSENPSTKSIDDTKKDHLNRKVIYTVGGVILIGSLFAFIVSSRGGSMEEEYEEEDEE